ncbi:Smr/MutS family protein [Pelagibacterium xiamenense]|uniref:Smr/MutS family protein n=1 Tax=Pelagibacterium xiamenense TaxID=2901140 RepID=UPI001E5F5BB0|nr:Smr/MutS family protein [Pelagibacterium xiamenense]MCD7058435.1 Smr/MutS family protein [Pelagibacterium xiamenense]
MSKKGSDKRKTSGPLRDWHLWREVGKTVNPIQRRKTQDPKALLDELDAALNARPQPDKPPKDAPPRLAAPSMPSARPVISAARPPLDKPIEPGLRKRLERGHLPIDATLDLHGMTQEEAHAALHRFIPARAARGDRTILVITGKGLKKTGYLQIEQKGVLRSMVPVWLKAPELAPFVAGVDRAHQSHGGEGALYIRLKRKREHRP